MNGKIIIGTELNTKSFDRQIDDLEERLKVIDAQLNAPKTFGLDKTDIQELEIEAEKLANRLVQLKRQQAEMNTQGLQKISKSMNAIIKKVGKWALAVFGVRSAYMFVRQAMSTLSQYDKQLATDIEFIRYVVATTLEPVIKFIVQLAYKLLTAINIIWTKLFGVSLFSKNLAKNFKNAKNQANGLKKTLAGFDEMNVLGSGGMGVNLSPSFDPSKADKGMEDWINNVIKKIQGFASIITRTLNGIFPGLNFSSVGTMLVKEIEGAFNMIKGIINKDTPTINKGIGSWVDSLLLKIKSLPSIMELAVLSQGGGVGIFAKLGTYLGQKFAPNVKNIFKQLWKGIKQAGIDMWNGLKSAGKGFLNGLIEMLNILITGLNGLLIPLRAIIVGMGKIMGKNWTFDTIKIPKIPRLAKGGIVNLPGKGVPVGNAYAGEKSAEGVIPLTDSQQMALLGEAIGKYITINATVVNSMNGRVLSREIQKIQNQSDFAMNR